MRHWYIPGSTVHVDQSNHACGLHPASRDLVEDKPMRSTCLCLFAVTAMTCAASAETQSDAVVVCPRINAKAMPADFRVPAMAFTGPAGDGRRGSAGFVVQAQGDSTGVPGTRWEFAFQRAPSGYHFQVIHPFNNGHVLVSLARGVKIHRGGSWSKIGWGDSAGSDMIELTDAGKETTGAWLPHDRPHQIVSQLTAGGEYEFWIDGALVCRHQIEDAKPLVLEVSEDRVWGGSSWDRTPFSGKDFKPQLQAGHAGLILGPMDGSGPTQNFQNITLKRLATTQSADDRFTPLFGRIDVARESEATKQSRAAGGGGGGAFTNTPDKPSVLVGFDYTTATFYGGHLTIKSLRPIFHTSEGDVVGKWHGVPHRTPKRIRAKPGYVVAGVIAKSGHRLDGMRVIFMKVEYDRLNPDETYRSNWIGGRGGGPIVQLAGDGDAIIGLYGRQGHDLDALGFVQVKPY